MQIMFFSKCSKTLLFEHEIRFIHQRIKKKKKKIKLLNNIFWRF